MIAGSKSRYRACRPSHDVLSNARVFDGDEVQIWSGDVDLTVCDATVTPDCVRR